METSVAAYILSPVNCIMDTKKCRLYRPSNVDDRSQLRVAKSILIKATVFSSDSPS